MAKGKIKKVFPGGNTCLGFYSFYNYIIGEEARRIFILKGGAGNRQVHIYEADWGETPGAGLRHGIPLVLF
jgi:hypothetical protein